MPASVESIVRAAVAEWEEWGESTWDLRTRKKQIGHVDDDFFYAAKILEEYCPTAARNPSLANIRNKSYYWSAVFISTVMKNAGYTCDEFPYAQRHAIFIQHFVAARRAGDASAAFWAYRQGEAGGAPEPGDLVAYARGPEATADSAPRFFDRNDAYDSHSDIVVAKRPGVLEVIGGNVQRSVTKKILALDADGHIADPTHHWFAVLKRRG